MRRMYYKISRRRNIPGRIPGILSKRAAGKLTVYSRESFVVCLPLMLFALILTAALMFAPLTASAAGVDAQQAVYENPGTGYAVYIIDGQDLLSEQEEAELLEDMIPVTEYGNAAFVSDYARVPSSEWARNCFDVLFGNASGALFLVEMNSRELYLYSNGEIFRTVNPRIAASIVDNVYTYASEGDFCECAAGVFGQICTMMEGGRISQPMNTARWGILALSGLGLVVSSVFFP